MSTFTEEVARGAALLDRIKPEWRVKINPDTLDLADTQSCVLGQTFGRYGFGLRALREHVEPDLLGSMLIPAIEHGFNLPEAVCQCGQDEDVELCDATCEAAAWDALRDEWLRVLKS